jgi:hypothetical protein
MTRSAAEKSTVSSRQQYRHIDVKGSKLAGTSSATHGCRTDA